MNAVQRDDLYARQEALNVNPHKAVAVVGCGGVGWWIGLFLSLAGIKRLHLFDGDVVDETNRNRISAPASLVGVNKTVALGEEIARLRPDAKVFVHGNLDPMEALGHNAILARCDWIVCSTDSLKSRQMTHQMTKKAGARYIECGADGNDMTVTFSPADFATPEEENPGYRTVPVFVGPCTLAASIAVYYILSSLWVTDKVTHRATMTGANARDVDATYLELSTIWDNDEAPVGEAFINAGVAEILTEGREDEQEE